MSNKSVLEKAQSISAILSAIAIPVVLGLTGYAVQQSIAQDGIKKDYLTMAVGMLQQKDGLDPSLKSWATAVVSKYSPVPFSSEAEEKLGSALYIFPPVPNLPEFARQRDSADLCEGGCSASLKKDIESWHKIIDEAGDENKSDGLAKVLSKSMEKNLALSAALDESIISGSACVRIYDSLNK